MKNQFNCIDIAFLFVYSLSKYLNRFSYIELFALYLSFCVLLNITEFRSLFLQILLSFSNINIFILDYSSLVDLINLMVTEKILVMNLLCYISIFLVAEAFSYCFLTKNICRKNFHILSFFIFINQNDLIIKASAMLLLISVIALKNNLLKKLNFLLNDNAREKDEFSFIILLLSLLTPRFILSKKQYLNFLISLCVMDSAASIFGKLFLAKNKSNIGFFFGLTSSLFIEHIYHKQVSLLYHFLMTTVERISTGNDNLLISLSAILYYKGEEMLVRWAKENHY